MKHAFEDLEMHALARAALRFYEVPAARAGSGMSEEEFLAALRTALRQLPSRRVYEAGSDLLQVARFIRLRGNPEGADRIAHEVAIAAQGTVERQGRVALFSQTQVGEAPRMHPKDLPIQRVESTKTNPKPGVVKARWASMSDARRRRLAELAEEISEYR